LPEYDGSLQFPLFAEAFTPTGVFGLFPDTFAPVPTKESVTQPFYWAQKANAAGAYLGKIKPKTIMLLQPVKTKMTFSL